MSDTEPLPPLSSPTMSSPTMSSPTMSSVSRMLAAGMLLLMVCLSVPAQCQDGSEWDRARAALIASQRGSMADAVARWKQLSSSDDYGFDNYAGFLIVYPGFPDEWKLRLFAEKALAERGADAGRIIAFCDRFPPLTNPGRAAYAMALSNLHRPEAAEQSRAAWRGGPMSDGAEAALMAMYGSGFTAADYDARADALLWAGGADKAGDQVGRAIIYASAAAKPMLSARLALVRGQDPAALGISLGTEALRDPGYVYTRAQQLRRSGQMGAAITLLASRPPLAKLPLDSRKWVNELLTEAKGSGADGAARIAATIDDGFAPGTDISREIFMVRDDYTSLMWLGGTAALEKLSDGRRAAPLFYRYGAAARTPQTRSKGFYWAGRAAQQGGDSGEAARYFGMAARYPDQFYGLLALERLGAPLPNLSDPPVPPPSAAERAAFQRKPITLAVREVSRDFDWPTTIRFLREISDQAVSEGDHALVLEYARELGRRDLAVILGETAENHGLSQFRAASFPQIPVPAGADWTMIHAITRQESQFSQNAVSHAGARGLMQLMPGTASGEAHKIGLSYNFGDLTRDAQYNLALGNSVFAHNMDLYGGSYPLAVAAYNAGPGNVNRWLREYGDPRYNGADWVSWIEHIPLTETRGYVQHVLENAVVYEALNPGRSRYRGANPLSFFLGKRTPG